jgi:hypothetical protein
MVHSFELQDYTRVFDPASALRRVVGRPLAGVG